MQSLDGKKRDIFEVVGEKGLFSVEKQSIKLSERDLSGTGQIPVFSSQTSNNGVMGFTNKVADFFIKDTPALIFGDHTKSMDISSHSFCAADNVKVLRPHNIPFDALFYVSCAWKKRIPDMGYARHWRKAKKVGIELPVTDSGEPDYAYMAEYVKQKRDAMLAKYRVYVEKHIAELGEVTEIPALNEKEWCKFSAFGPSGLFEIVTTSSSIDSVRLVDGDEKTVPYVTRTNTSNGIACFVSPDNLSYGSDCAECITVGLDTQTAFWQPYEFVTGQNIQVITGSKLNFYRAQFLIPLFKSQMCAKFNWGGNGATLGRMKKLELMLPVTSSGEPDYEYMEQYTKNMMIRKYQQYLTFLQKGSNTSRHP